MYLISDDPQEQMQIAPVVPPCFCCWIAHPDPIDEWLDLAEHTGGSSDFKNKSPCPAQVGT